MPLKPSVLITGASTGIGAVYADRFARRGHDLVLVARDRGRMEELGDHLRGEKGVEVDIVRADLTDARDLVLAEARLRDDYRIGVLINNAGINGAGGFVTKPGRSNQDRESQRDGSLAARQRGRTAIRPGGGRLDCQYRFRCRVDARMRFHGLRGDQSVHPFPEPGSSDRAGAQGRLCSGRAAGLDADGYLEALRQGCGQGPGHYGS